MVCIFTNKQRQATTRLYKLRQTNNNVFFFIFHVFQWLDLNADSDRLTPINM